MINKNCNKKEKIEAYSVTLAGIDKALALKKSIDLSHHLPKWLGKEFEKNFLPDEANKLRDHRLEIDLHISLEIDSNGVKKSVT